VNQTLAITTGYFYVLSVLCIFNLLCAKDVFNRINTSKKGLIRHAVVSLLSPLCWPIIFVILLYNEIKMRKVTSDLREMLNQMYDEVRMRKEPDDYWDSVEANHDEYIEYLKQED
jgi:hypothetical protein